MINFEGDNVKEFKVLPVLHMFDLVNEQDESLELSSSSDEERMTDSNDSISNNLLYYNMYSFIFFRYIR